MTSYEYTRQALARDVHTCARCGATMRVTLHAIGTTAPIEDRHDTLAVREAAMQEALVHDVRSALPLVRCTSCRERETLPVVFAVTRVSLWFAAAPILPIIAPISLGALWMIPFGLTLAGVGQWMRERSKFRRVAAALVVQLTGPTRKPVDRTPRAALPAARATKLPPARPPVLAAAPPPPAAPPLEPSSSDGPRFLTATATATDAGDPEPRS